MKIVDITNSCRTCSHKMYFTGGQYECAKLNKIINDISIIPNWCPLPEYPSQVIQDLEMQVSTLTSQCVDAKCISHLRRVETAAIAVTTCETMQGSIFQLLMVNLEKALRGEKT